MSSPRSSLRFLRCIAASWAMHGTALALAAAVVGWRLASTPSSPVRVALVRPAEAAVVILPEPVEQTEVRALPEPSLDPERDPVIEPAPPVEPTPPTDLIPLAEEPRWDSLSEVFAVPAEPAEREATPPAEPDAPSPAATPMIVVENEPAVLVDGPAPEYPARSVRRGEEGSVLCRLTIEADGRVSDVQVVESSGYARLDEAAVEALRRWRFRPRTEGGVALPSELLHSVTFRLEAR